MIAYDFETTRIAPGTPDVRYLTAFSENPAFSFEGRIDSIPQLHAILVAQFLTDAHAGCKFVAWNANNFDAYFIAAALVCDSRYVIRPYLTRNCSLRGMRVLLAEDLEKPNARSWEFLDGIAMLGLVGTKLEKFLANFAPDHAKLTGVIDFEKEEFDPENPRHREYAMRDSVGLWHGMHHAQRIMLKNFNQPLTVTMGGACIKIFKAHIPRGVTIHTARDEIIRIVREFAMRGGFCYLARRFDGPVWKYDLNQAYAAAMREAKLPAGLTSYHRGKPPAGVPALLRVTGTHRSNLIPFYYRTEIDGYPRSRFDRFEIHETWITSIEFDQLISEGWRLTVTESYSWGESFTMSEYVGKLETLRQTCEGGPSGPIGTMAKATGNHSYGKTVEQNEPLEFVLADECPPGYVPYFGDPLTDPDPLEHVFARYVQDQKPKDYHQPQIGAFITAHVRMVVRRAALLDPTAWLYADTDCVIFSRDVTAKLDIHPSRYGAWKIEESGTRYQLIAKKVYREVEEPGSAADKSKRSAKGLNVKRLTAEDFQSWFDGTPPEQLQTQRQNFLIVLRGAEMYKAQRRSGTAVESVTSKPRKPRASV